MSIIPKPFIASSVFVDTPSYTPGSFSSGVSFADAVNSVNTVQTKTMTISSAEILAMNTTPIEIVPAIPNGVIEPLSFFWKLNFNTTAYDITGISEINLLYDPSSAAVKFFQSTSAACLGSPTTATYVFPKYPYTAAEKLTVNKPLCLTADADPTLGDSTVTVEVLYRVATIE